MKNLLTTILCSILGLAATEAQNTHVEGNILGTDSTTTIPGVSIYIENTQMGTASNGNGNYRLKNVPVGTHTLVVSSIGYFTVKREIEVKNGQASVQNFIISETISTLSEVTVTGGKAGIKDIPGSVHYMSPKEIQRFGYTDINRALRAVPGVNVQEEDGFGLFPSIGLRGTGVERNTKITVMEDGILMAPAPYAAPAAYYFPTMGRMQGIEIIKGSSQIKYGPYTTGGAINLISTQIPNSFSGRVNLWGGSFGGRNLHAHVGNSHKNFGYVVETFIYGSNGFKQLDGATNRGIDRNSGFNKQDYLMKFRVNTNAQAKVYQSLTFKAGQSTGNVNETYLGLTQEDFDQNPIRRYAGSQMDLITTAQTQFSLTHRAKITKWFDVTTVGYRTNFSRNWYKLDKVKDSTGTKIGISDLLDNPSAFNDAYAIVAGATSVLEDALFVKANNRSYFSQGVQTKLSFNFKTGKMAHVIDVGIRIHRDQIDRFQWIDEYAMDNGVMELTAAGVRGTESNRVETADAVASYIQYRLRIGKFTATPGLRFEHITQKRKDYGKTDPTRTGANISERSNTVNVLIPGIGFDYHFNSKVSVFAGIHKGFSPPGSKEELQPEQSINYELGSRYSEKGLSGQVVLFFNDYSNLLGTDLEAAGGGGTNEQFNGGAVRSMGVEFNATYDLLSSRKKNAFRLPLTVVYSYTDARFQNSFDSDFGGWGEVSKGDQFPYLANNQFTVMLSLEHHRFSLNISGKYMDEMRTAPGQGKRPVDEKTDQYFVLDASVKYNVHARVSFFANATNLTNKVYVVARRPAGLRPGMPRAFNIGVRANF